MSAWIFRRAREAISLALAAGCAHARTVVIQMSRELARLNAARFAPETFARLPRKQRIRLVKRALAAHHRAASRCC